MSTNDNSKPSGQKFKHLDSNVYQIQPRQIQPKQKAPAKPRITSHILKTGDLNSMQSLASVQIGKYVPSDLVGKRAMPILADNAPLDLSKTSPASLALEGMKQNLKSLNALQARLRFVLKELEQLVHE